MKEYVTHAIIQIGTFKKFDGFKTKEGMYVMSQTQTAETVGENKQNVSDFLRSKAFKTIWGEGFTSQTFEVEDSTQLIGQPRINGLPLKIVIIYWNYRSYRGNKEAYKILSVLALDSLEDHFRHAFGETATMEERRQRIDAYVQELEERLNAANETIAQQELDLRQSWEEYDVQQSYQDEYDRQLREHGINPWAVPNTEDEHL